MTTTSTSRPESLRRRQGLTEQAAQAAIDQACRRLRLPTIRAVVDDAVTAATKEQLTYQGFLAELLLAEVDDRDRRSTLRRIKSAGFPREKWLADFDFTANPNINPATINELATGDWIRRGDPLCLIGGSGTGKSHLLIALGTAAEQGYRVRYTLATRLVDEARREAARIRDNAQSEAKEIVAQARTDAQAEAAGIVEGAQRQILADKQAAQISLRTDVGMLATTLAERIVGEQLKDTALSERVIDRFLDDLEAMPPVDGVDAAVTTGPASEPAPEEKP